MPKVNRESVLNALQTKLDETRAVLVEKEGKLDEQIVQWKKTAPERFAKWVEGYDRVTHNEAAPKVIEAPHNHFWSETRMVAQIQNAIAFVEASPVTKDGSVMLSPTSQPLQLLGWL